MSLSGPGLAASASPRVPEQFPPSAFTLTTLLELRSFASLYRSVGKRFEIAFVCVCVCDDNIARRWRLAQGLAPMKPRKWTR